MLPILLTTAFATRAPSLLYVDAVGPEPREFIQNLEERGVDVYRVFSRPFIAGVEQAGLALRVLGPLLVLVIAFFLQFCCFFHPSPRVAWSTR